MRILETMVANDPGGRVTVTFLGEGSEAVEVHMAGAADALPPREYVKKAKVMLLEAAAVGDGTPPPPRDKADDLTASPMAAEKHDPFASSPGEDDDNAYQSSDEALPDDAEEAALDRSPSREDTRFDQI